MMPSDTVATSSSLVTRNELLKENYNEAFERLYGFQKEGIKYIGKKRRVILGDEMGLGKTVQALLSVIGNTNPPYLVVVGLRLAMGVWKREIKKWTGLDSLIYHGTPNTRKVLWDEWNFQKTPFIITTAMLTKEVLAKQHVWPAVIIDEYHLAGLRNRNSKFYKTVKGMRCGMLILSSGSPIAQGPQDLWSVLNILNPREFGSYWHFVNRHCVVELGYSGYKEIKRYPKRPKEFQELISPYIIRRRKKDVLTQLPPKTRRVIPIALDPSGPQNRMYNQLNKEMMAELGNGEIVVTPQVISKIIVLRKLLVSPKLIGEDYLGEGIETLLTSVEDDLTQNLNIAIFTPFREGVNVIAEALRRYNSAKIYKVMGGMKSEDMNSQIDKFQSHDKHGILIATIKSAVSFTAHAAHTAYFLGQEWSFNDNEQAEDRLHRVGQTDNVFINYIKHENTIEDRVVEVLMDKRDATSITLHSPRYVVAESITKPLRRKPFSHLD